ncbi:MAG: glycogen debranching protein GlgX [Candidatus Obscuribacterales bacterium]|nr:glycogen debranching protein GlgX [Candidatus Obscuribacterales bacterium]
MKALEKVGTQRGTTFPLGATVMEGGVNFSIFSKHATGMDLVLFPSDELDAITIVPLDPVVNRTYFYWHIFVNGVGAGQQYGFKAHGPNDAQKGLRFDSQKLLLDPYCRAVANWNHYDRQAACSPGDNTATALRSVVLDTACYDWAGESRPATPYAETVIYEMHVGGFTRNSNSGLPAAKRGTFAGIIEKIPYLKDLGVTAVELMPVQEFDPCADEHENYWGYNTLAFFAPHHGFCVGGNTVEGINQFKDMVKALHTNGIEVILDVVFNHTAEGNENGPTLSFKGLDNPIYYTLEEGTGRYCNYSGCGNSFNGNHPVVTRLIMDSLRYWVREMHVDGFRFDLAAALSRDVHGQVLSLPPLLWMIESDPVLAGTKLIAEAWDAAGLYKVGWFVNSSNWYAEWNGPFRDDVRRFVKGDENSVTAVASRIAGSGDIYVDSRREPNRSVNFVTCHDGFTLRDLVSFNGKHNEANGEDNRDGSDANHSWNCGAEGQSSDAEVELLRLRQMKNLLAILFLSQGTPMMLMGDEVGRTQHGNNNAYCHNSETTWFDWDQLQSQAGLLEFTKKLVKFTQASAVFGQQKAVNASLADDTVRLIWHGVKLWQPDFSADSHSLAFTLELPATGERLHVILNMFWEPLEFELPDPIGVKGWKRIVDTFLTSPEDFTLPDQATLVQERLYRCEPRSVVVLCQ